MSKLPTTADLRSETRDWLNRGVVPGKAAQMRRGMARSVPLLAGWHNAFAAEWDRIAKVETQKMITCYERQRDYALGCMANQVAGSDLERYWQDEAAKWDAEILAIDPDYEPAR